MLTFSLKSTVFNNPIQIMENKQFQASFIVQQYVEIFSRENNPQQANQPPPPQQQQQQQAFNTTMGQPQQQHQMQS